MDPEGISSAAPNPLFANNIERLWDLLTQLFSPKELVEKSHELLEMLVTCSNTDGNVTSMGESNSLTERPGECSNPMAMRRVRLEVAGLQEGIQGMSAAQELYRRLVSLAGSTAIEPVPTSVLELTKGLIAIQLGLLGVDGTESLCAYDPYLRDGSLLLQVCSLDPEIAICGCNRRDDEMARLVWGDSLLHLNSTYESVETDALLADPFKNRLFLLVVSMLPLNQGAWQDGEEDVAASTDWPFGKPPANKANLAWLQHALIHLEPDGAALLIVSNDVLTTMRNEEMIIKKNLIADGRLSTVITLPSRLFYHRSTGLSVLIFNPRKREKAQSVLFVNAQEQGRLLNDGIHRELTTEASERIVRIFCAWTGTSGSYRDEEGFCRAVDPVEIEKNHFIMAPQYYTTAQQDAQTELPQTAGLHIERLKSILREEALIDAELLDLLVGFSDVCH